MSTDFLYVVFYFAFHGLYSVFEFVRKGFAYLYNTIVHIIFMLNYHPDRSRLYKAVSESSKMPRHITVLLGGEEPSYGSLANLVMWCLALGIPFISFYDHTGVLKKHQEELEYEVDKKRLKECTIIWHNDPSSGYKNGIKGSKIHVKILSESDGKGSIVSVCKELAVSDNSTLNFSVESISEKLHKHYEFPDPDLALYCGDTFCLFDYPPWQVRVTEFFNVATHHNLTFDQFGDILLRYMRCEQRLGT